LWFAALTGFREACLNTSCQGPPNSESKAETEKSSNVIIATNRLLWRSLVLVKVNKESWRFILLVYIDINMPQLKLPLLLSKLKERKELEEEKRGDIKKPLNGNDVSKKNISTLKKRNSPFIL
jgi:hypothetical protein